MERRTRERKREMDREVGYGLDAVLQHDHWPVVDGPSVSAADGDHVRKSAEISAGREGVGLNVC